MSKLHAAIAAALVLSLLGGSSAAVLAQPADEVTPAAGVNADRVDGKNAVGSGASIQQRAKKLVATNKQGLLPSNIVKPLWNLIQGIPGILADGLVGFDEIAGMPASFADGQIAFGEVTGMPAGFADGVDDGITKMTTSQVVGTAVVLAANGNGEATATCPAGSVPISGGHTASSFLVFNVSSFRIGAGWIVAARNTDAVPRTLTAIVHCVATLPSTSISSISIAKKTAVKSANSNKPPTPKKGK
jgi:hypothetical protein